jgi:flagellar hook-associated protein 2
MGSIVSSGVGSGLDISGLVQKLVEAEGTPKSLRLDTEEAKVQAKLSALGTLRSALASFRDTVSVLKNVEKFQGRQATSSSPDFLAVTAASAAVPGSYSIEVDQLAAAHKLQSNAYVDSTAAIGTGTLQITVAGTIYDVVIDAESNTLAGIASAINASAAGEKVVATVITGDDDARLTITSRATGEEHAVAIAQSGGDGGLAALEFPPGVGGLNEIQAAADARVFIDGITVTSATNTLSGAIASVDVTVKEVNANGETTTVTVGYDRDAARKTIDDFVKSYNALVDAIKNVSSYNAETRQGAPLFGDAGVRNMTYQLRRELTSGTSGVDGPFDMLAEIGITAQLDGKLSVDTADLDAAFALPIVQRRVR